MSADRRETLLANLVLREEGTDGPRPDLHHWSLNLVIHGEFFPIIDRVLAVDGHQAARLFARMLGTRRP